MSQISHTERKRVPLERLFCSQGRKATLLYSSIFFALLILFYGGLYVLWVTNAGLYTGILKFLGVRVWSFPFLDTAGFLSWIDCHDRGFDTLVNNPCDPLNRPMDYSPIFLDFPAWLRVGDTPAVGLIMSFAFLATLPLVLRPSCLSSLALACLASMSTAVLFGVERGNLDLFLFTLIAIAGLMAVEYRQVRFVPYAIFILAGLLKFYPFVLLLTSIRERPRVFAVVAAASVAIILLFTFVHWNEILKVLSLQPGFVFWGDTFGARELPYGVVYYFGLRRLAEIPVWLLMFVAFCYLAWRLGGRLLRAMEHTSCNPKNAQFLMLGSILMVGCFFAGVNVGYRALYLLFVLPGLSELMGRLGDRSLKRVLALTQCGIFFALWKDFLRHGVDSIFGPFSRTAKGFPAEDWPYLGFFLFRELCWWWVIAVLSILVARFVMDSWLWRALIAARPTVIASK